MHHRPDRPDTCRSLARVISALTLPLVIAAGPHASAASADQYLHFNRIVDGIGATSEHGYAFNSINSISYITWNLYTHGNQQFAAFYSYNPNNPSDPANNEVLIARRDTGELYWDILKTGLASNGITDDHNNVNFNIDGDGYMHLSWGMHGNPYHYAKSLQPVTGSNPLTMSSDLGTQTGREANVTYPQFYNLPDGDLLYLFREGTSGNGDFYLNRYDTATDTWDNVHENTSNTNHLPLLAGSGFSPNWNSYPNRMVLDDNQRLHLTWTNRYQGDSPAGESGYQTNHNMYYAYSDDLGVSWKRMDGSSYELSIVDPIVASQVSAARLGDIAVHIPEGSSLINQAAMTVDHHNYPLFATWYAPNAQSGDHRRQYMVGFWDGDSWQTRQVSDRTIDVPWQKKNESAVRDLARPQVLVDDAGRIIVIYRDNQDANGITIAHTKSYADDPDRNEWFTFDLTTENMGTYEPTYDPVVWEQQNKLHLLYQQHSGFGNNFTGSWVYVMEWDARSYFASLEGDLNLDGLTTQLDLDILLRHWGRAVAPGSLANGDPTGDGLANHADLRLILQHWDAITAPIYTVPEPATAMILLGLLPGLTRRRRHRHR